MWKRFDQSKFDQAQFDQSRLEDMMNRGQNPLLGVPSDLTDLSEPETIPNPFRYDHLTKPNYISY